MSGKRIKLSSEKYSAWAHKQQPSSCGLPQSVEMTRIVRDAEGNVHTPNGYLSREAYEQARAENPKVGLPAWEAIPYLNELTEAGEDDWRQHIRWADDGGPEVTIQ